MSELAIITPKSVQETAELATRLAKSALLPEAYRGKEPDVFLTLLAGSELGLLPVQSLNAFDVIKGKAAMKPVAMLALVRSHHSVEYVRVAASATSATITSKLRGDDFIAQTTFTMEQAQKAGLAGNDNYRRFPQQMLTWRCTGLHCRTHHGDIIGGYYTTEEAETFEKDVTPVAPRVDAQSAVEVAKATVKAKRTMRIIDEPKATPPPAETAAGELAPLLVDGKLTWPEAYQGKALERLTQKQLDWCVGAATKQTNTGGDTREAWADRLMTFTDEVARRLAVEAATPTQPAEVVHFDAEVSP